MSKYHAHFRTILRITLIAVTFAYWGCTKVAEETDAHPEGWVDTASSTFHSLRVTVSGLESCKQCHGENLEGGTSGQACTSGDCHIRGAAIPHPTDWRLPGNDNFHGTWALSVGFSPCTKCHGADLQGSFTEKACNDCHTGPGEIPHPDDWATPEAVNFHGNWIPVVGVASCQDCHGDDFSGGVVNVACSNTTCHTAGDAIPHPDEWTDSEDDAFHGEWVETAGFASCTACHGSDFSGGWAETACSNTTCHTGGDAIPHPDGWTNPENADFHGSWIPTAGLSSCNACHGSDFGGGWAEAPCSNTTCHLEGDAIPHPSGWTTPDNEDFHGAWIAADGYTSCKACHGSDFLGGITEIACSNTSCHPGAGAIPHPFGWTTDEHVNFHGDFIGTAGFPYCKTCHGDSFGGGFSETPCSSTSCHTGVNAIPHPAGWITPADPNFHGDLVGSEGWSNCQKCHGDDLDGGIAELACSSASCHTEGDAIPHPDEWTTSGADLFHGNWVREVGDAPCADCHGSDYLGGFTEMACTNASCHVGGGSSPHPVLAEFIDPEHANYHGAIFWDNNFDFADCQDCHGSNLDGGVVDFSCSNVTCHTATDGVYACDNCHSSATSNLPFTNVRNETDSTVASVGLHNSHLSPVRAVRPAMACDDCHEVPASMWATGHIDATPDEAEVPFGTLATHSGSLTPVWDHSGGTCADTYCHGNFAFAKDTSSYQFAYEDTVMVGNNATASWTEVYTGGNFCSFCHGYPPTGHYQTFTTCGGCHANVVGGDHLSIIDLSKHLNGQNDYP
ncbi:hypothetical protein ACFL5M_00110 [Candidatus Neomarinimicrobiota bacterium]